MIVPGEILAMRDIVEYWTSATTIPTAGWIGIFAAVPIVFSFFNVRKYGEFEYWISMVKVVALLVIILLGILLRPLGATGKSPLLVTNDFKPVLCESIKNCLLCPGFNCTFFHNEAKFRLERGAFQRNYRYRTRRRSCRRLGVLL